MEYKISIKKSILKNLKKMPLSIKQKFEILVKILRKSGPTGPCNWNNYSKLSKYKYHCHLSYHYVACWEYKKETLIIEVYYVGSREKAPY